MAGAGHGSAAFPLHIDINLLQLPELNSGCMKFPEFSLTLAAQFQKELIKTALAEVAGERVGPPVLDGAQTKATARWEARGDFAGVSIAFTTSIDNPAESKSKIELAGDAEKCRILHRRLREHISNLRVNKQFKKWGAAPQLPPAKKLST